MNTASTLRMALYLIAMVASGSTFAQFAIFDPVTWTVDILPFDLKAAATVGFTTLTSAMSALAVWKGWGK